MARPVSIRRSSLTDLWQFLRAYVWLFRAKRLMKRARGSQWVVPDHGSERPLDETTRDLVEDRALIKSRVAAISRASRYPKKWAFCLQQSLALREWLATDGVYTNVRYGVRKNVDSFDAHAWVEHDGKIVNDSVRHVSTFAPLKTFDDYGKDSSRVIQSALESSRVESRGAGGPA